MKVGAAVARLDGSGDVVPQILPGDQAHIDDGVVGQIGGQDDDVNDRVTQRDQSRGPSAGGGLLVALGEPCVRYDVRH